MERKGEEKMRTRRPIRRKLRQEKEVFFVFFIVLGLMSPRFSFSAERPVLNVPRFIHPPKIDGVIENPLWEEEALKIENFFQLAPKEMGEPSEKTVAYVGYDRKNIYFAFRCYDSEPKKIRATVTNRDGCIDDDWIAFFIDTFNEKRRAFAFIINPLGIQIDSIRTEEGGGDNMDLSWDTVFYSHGRIDKEGYTVEVAIPFKSLRFPDAEKKVWGLNLARNIPRKGEIILWPAFTRKIPGVLAQAGDIILEGRLEKGKNLEIMPVVTSLTTNEKNINLRPGVNIKYGVSSDLTLDATFNPDFSHIEADAPQIDVNRRFALYYPEKRPFFLEGMEIFQFPEIDIVYTRRIIEPIVGAKATGKVGSFTYGFLSAYDLSPTESLWDISGGGGNGKDKALFNIFRLKTDVFKESYLGFCFADKEIDGSYNRVAGIDGTWKFENKYFFNFQLVASKTKYGEEETGIAPAVYAESFYFSKHWSAGGYWMSIHPDFIASSGFVNRADYKSYGAFANFRFYPEKKFLNVVGFGFRAGQRHDYFGSSLQDKWANANIYLEFNQFSRMNINFSASMERYGGLNFNKKSFNINGNTNIIGWLPFGFYFEIGDSIFYDPDNPFLGFSYVLGCFLNFKPSKRLQMQVEYSRYNFWQERGGPLLIDFNVIRQRTTYQISKTLSLRAIIDYNFFDKEAYGSFLVSWILRPGTVFFLGLDTNYLRNELGSFERSAYSVFVKFSYWWRI